MTIASNRKRELNRVLSENKRLKDHLTKSRHEVETLVSDRFELRDKLSKYETFVSVNKNRKIWRALFLGLCVIEIGILAYLKYFS